MRYRVYVTLKRPSVSPSVCPVYRQQQRPPAGLLLSAPWGRIYRSIAGTALSNQCGQCRVDSRGTRLNTNLFLLHTVCLTLLLCPMFVYSHVTLPFGLSRSIFLVSLLTYRRRGVVVSGVRRMNEVNARRARLVPGWVTVFRLVYHLGM